MHKSKPGLTIAAALFVIAGLALLLWFIVYTHHAPWPAFDTVRAAYQGSDARLLDRHGRVIAELRVDAKARRMQWTRLKDISPCLTRAVVQAEDRRFYRHHGVDWAALAGGLVRPGKARGASTISMQLTAVLDGHLKPKRGRRSALEKIRQMRCALALERGWSKPQILEAYLNLITFRGELQGIAAASRGLFDKEPSGINDAEALVLAALIPSSNMPLERICRRAHALGMSMGLACAPQELSSLVKERLGKPYQVRPRIALAPLVAQRLLSKDRREVRSTLDAGVQAFVMDTLARHVEELAGRNVHDGAALVVDNATGDILAYVGNTGARSSSPYVDGIRAVRQAGSALKPFLYERAIERELLTAASILEDTPLQIPTPTGLYIPEDYAHEYLGPVSVRTALASSLNIPAVRALQIVGIEDFVQRLKALGFTSIRKEADYYGYALALGSVDITLADLVNAYRTLANQGAWSLLRFEPGEDKPQPATVMNPRAVFIVASILSDRESRAATFGLENFLSTRFWTAVKTGTSKDMRDNWCIGYSRHYTVGVWVGNFWGDPMWNVSGVSGAAPVWLEIMNFLHQGLGSLPPAVPPGVVKQLAHFPHKVEPTRVEWFLADTEPLGDIVLNTAHVRPTITYPSPGSIVVLDPDIPEANQSMAFEASTTDNHYQWRLNGRLIGTGSPLLWRLRRGSFTLTLLDRRLMTMDTVTFVVR